MKKQKPWMDENGNTLEDTTLKEVSRGWSAETWSAYLDSRENRSHEENECNIADLSIIDDLGVAGLSALQSSADHLSDELLDDVKCAIEKLPKRERFAIEEEFYLGKSQRCVARELGISRASVRKIRKKSFRKLMGKLSKHQHS